MKKQILITSLLILFTSVIFLGWGDKGHKIVASYAMKDLTSVMQVPQDWQEYIINHASDPDYRKSEDKTEAPKHFIDIDYYKEYLNGAMVQSIDSLRLIYSDSLIQKQGVLPWAIETTYQNLVKALKEKNKSKILLYMSDAAHYVGDAHQPQHTTVNYNGQLSGQKGVHFRYESDMLDANLDEIKNNYEAGKPVKINSIREFTFNVIHRTNTFNDMINAADKASLQIAGKGKYDDTYYKALWYRLKFMSIDLLNLAGKDLASVLYTAWLEAGSPDLTLIK
jgi:hypothetical protein